MITIYHVGIIGAGKVGTSLALYFFKKSDLRLNGFYSKNTENAAYSAKLAQCKFYSTIGEIAEDNDVLIITTPDDEIKGVWDQLLQFNMEGKVVCHCSGSLSSEIFFDSTIKKVACCSFHPMLAISSKEDSYKALDGAFFTLEGDAGAVHIIAGELKRTGNPFKVIASCDKRKYHLATVFISNLVIALADVSVTLLRDYDFTQEEALQALSTLGQNNLKTFFAKGAVASLTGPVERNDLHTVQGHIASIAEPEKDLERHLYKNLSRYLVEIAKVKNPARDYSGMEKLLETEDAD